MRIGVMAPVFSELGEIVALAERAELAGFDSVWLPDTVVARGDVFVTAAEVLRRTRRIRIGTMVANPVTRAWPVLAGGFVALGTLHPGRVDCGLARGDSFARVLAGHRPKMASLEGFAEVLERIRVAREGGTMSVGEETYDYGWVSGCEFDVLGLGLAEPVIEEVARRADGLLYQGGYPVNLRWAHRVLARAGGARPGPSLSRHRLCVALPGLVGSDVGAQVRSVEWFVRMVGGHLCDLAGVATGGEVLPEYMREYKASLYEPEHSGEIAARTALLRERIARDVCLLGPMEAHVERLAQIEAEHVDEVVVMLVDGFEEETLQSYARWLCASR